LHDQRGRNFADFKFSGLKFDSNVSKDMSAESYFDCLPPELILHILKFLPSKDVVSFADSNKRVEAILKDSSFALGQLVVKSAFFRRITDSFYFHPFRRCDVFFRFQTGPEARVKAVLDLATKIPTGGRLCLHRRLIIILADSLAEANDIHRGLQEKNLFSFISYGYIPSHVEFEILSQERVVFVVIRRINVNWRLSTMAAVISLQQPTVVEDFFEVQSLNPRRVYQFLESDSTGYESFKLVQAALKPHVATVPDRENALHLSRKFYEDRRRDITLNELYGGASSSPGSP